MSQLDDATTDPPGTDALTESEYYRLLSSERRRTLLAVLTGRSVPVELEELAAAIAEREGDTDTVRADAVERIVLTLHHVHLPLLAQLGIVDYDPTSHRVGSFRGRLLV